MLKTLHDTIYNRHNNWNKWKWKLDYSRWYTIANTHFLYLWSWLWGKGNTKRRPVPPTSFYLCTCKVWSYCKQRFRRCIYKKIILLTLDINTEEMHLQENTLFDLWLWPWSQGHANCCPAPSTSCYLCNCKVWNCYAQRIRRRCIYKRNLTFDLGAKGTQNVAQYPLQYTEGL